MVPQLLQRGTVGDEAAADVAGHHPVVGPVGLRGFDHLDVAGQSVMAAKGTAVVRRFIKAFNARDLSAGDVHSEDLRREPKQYT